MNITFLLPHLKISGGVRIGLNYAHFLAKRGHKVKVVVVSGTAWRRHLANLLQIKPKWFGNLAAEAVRVKDLSENNLPDADIIVSCNWDSAKMFKEYSPRKGAQFNIIMHDERLYHGQREEIEKVYKHPAKKIVISSWLREVMRNDFGVEAELFVAPVDFNLFHRAPVKRNGREIRVLMLDHTYEWKGTKDGLRAFMEVKKEIPNLELILFGVRKENADIPCDKYYYNLPQEKLAWLYSGCDIYLCPSRYEGLGMPAMEAMACGCAIVTFDTGGSRDYAFDGRTAFVAKHGDMADLSKKLFLAASDRRLRKKIAENGYDFIRNNLETWEESADRLEKVFIQSLKEA